MKSFVKSIVKQTNETLLEDLYKRPRKEKYYVNKSKFITPDEPNILQQADLLFLPDDDDYKYALVVVDTFDRRVDAIGLKDKKALNIIGGFKQIYEKHKILNYPNIMTIDQGKEFFNKDVIKYFEHHNTLVKVNERYRHRQNAFVETANKYIGSLIHKIQTNIELVTGQRYNKWI